MIYFAIRALLAVERAFESEGIHYVEISKNDHSTSPFLRFLDPKLGAWKAETLVLVTAEQRQNSKLCILNTTFSLVILIRTSIEKNILLA